MNAANFSLEFRLDMNEIRKLNKMYFKDLYKKRVMLFLAFMLFVVVFFDFFNLRNDNDFIQWIVGSLFLVILFLLFYYSIVDAICNMTFSLIKRLLKFERFVKKYQFSFTNSFICVRSPIGVFTHEWSCIEKAIITKDFLFLYVKDKNGYIISISNNYNDTRQMNELISFVNKNVTPITKI
ncbi:YcxB family protein [Flavobacterium hibernum]|uniref:YcxB-like C-terminal domain-containing protein n=1 Tax=Flavobacterium hibernum TaxID=37752 RepID=A0A0D0EFV6_9FLAO|nr:YcxB family protein [Flavobacterium hibernum]KIO54769.1 hypothetical protein IW18_01850 [Flavobacterium hibernum]OXA85714.1 hypothetical protein B0A73_15900 [Flavobacterium hibernum]STO18532.1 Uncharacterised protein [Flavobacterium hibernum]